MINAKSFLNILCNSGVDFFTGVPDSLLKSFCAYLLDHVDNENHIIASNEGAAIALAAGTYLATGRIPIVYMQNSGLGNAINPLLSLVDPAVYKIPILLLIGWRGKPGEPDEPQHIKQGRVQNKILNAIDIPYVILGPKVEDYKITLSDIINQALVRNGPVAIIVQKNTFEKYVGEKFKLMDNKGLIKRERALEIILDSLDPQDIIVSTTGMTSREVFEIRERRKDNHYKDFLTVGSMGHCSQISFGIALKKKDRQIYCVDGDGSIIMHMGSLAIIGEYKPRNFRHILINNAAHDSVGGQPTAASVIDFVGVARSCGYVYTASVDNEKDLIKQMGVVMKIEGPLLLEIKVKKGSRDDLGRPTITPYENRLNFENNLRKR